MVERVLIHDGARCLATPELFDRCSAALEQVDGLIAAIPVKDTIKVTETGPKGIQIPVSYTHLTLPTIYSV